jgi:hypothetical protein
MVTKFQNVFDKIGEVDTFYQRIYIHDNINENNFIQNSNCKFINLSSKKAFYGKIIKILYSDVSKIQFKAKLIIEIDYHLNYDNEKSGWYLNKGIEHIIPSGKINDENNLVSENSTLSLEIKNIFSPSFFPELNTTSDYRRFEELSYFLLKCIGINDIVKIDPNQAQGRPDGFFKIRNFAVIYDAKLSQHFHKDHQQINNYCDQLQKSTYEYNNQSFSLTSCSKAVWIITRGNYSLIKNHDGILVKEITVKKLFNLYLERLENNLTELELEQKLIQI